MAIEIKHRDTGAVVWSSEHPSLSEALTAAVAERANLRGADLGDANLRGANLGDADLGGANLGGANLGGANLGDANLRGANLGGAYLRGANLGGAYLGGANLGGANLGDANLGDANLIDAGVDVRGYRFVAVRPISDKPWIFAGCRAFTDVPSAITHWQNSKPEEGRDPQECLAKIALIEAVAKSRGWLKEEPTP